MVGELPASVTLDKSGKEIIPADRFSNYEEVSTLCRAVIQADRTRALFRSQIDSHLAGFPVYSLSKLKALGQGWRARVNYREMAGFINTRQQPLFDLISEVDHIIEVELDEKFKGQEREDIQQKLAKHFSWLILKRWRNGFNYHFPMSQREMLVHGIGAHVRPNPRDWRPRSPRNGHILFPENAPVNFCEDGDWFVLRDFIPDHVIYKYVRNEKAARALGWNPKACWKAMVMSSKNVTKASSNQIEEYQRQMQRGDMGFSMTRQAGVWVNFMFFKELDTDKISEYAVAEDVDPGDYLFKKRNLFSEWSDILTLYPLDIGFGTLYSIRGLGAQAKDFFELLNRVRNSMADQVMLGAYPNVEQTQPNIDPDKMRLARLGGLNITPYGVKPSLIQYPPLNNGPIAFSNELRGTLDRNSESVSFSSTPEPRDRETATSFSMRAQDSATVGKGMQDMYESNLCQEYDVMFRMVCDKSKTSGSTVSDKMAQEFRDRCKRDGVPETAYKAIAEVKEVTSSGSGSAALRWHIDELLFKYIWPNTSEDRKITIERDAVSNLVGYAKADRYARSLMDSDMPDQDDSFAVLENDALTNGGEAEVNTKQNDVKHLQKHFQKAAELVQMVQQGMLSPEAGYNAIHAIGEHSAVHLQNLAGNPMRQAEYKKFEAEWKSLAKFADKLHGLIQSQAQEQQSEQDVTGEFLKKLDYKTAPESVKERMESMGGIPRRTGDVSVPAHAAAIKNATLQLKAQKQNTQTVFDAAKIRMNGSKAA